MKHKLEFARNNIDKIAISFSSSFMNDSKWVKLLNTKQYYDVKTFYKDALNHWGSSLPALSEPNEGIHYYMTILAGGIRSKEISAIEVFDFLDLILLKDMVNSEIENAVAISFLEYTELTNLGLLTSTPDLVTNILKMQHEL